MFTLNAADAAFRDEVRAFLDKELTPDLRLAGRRSTGVFADRDVGLQWHRILNKKGWAVPHWPVEHGGTGWTPMQHYIFASEMADADAPPRSPQATHLAAPVIIEFGTAEQKAAWLPGIRNGDDYWCQGYSEPQSGSDLAALQCRATLSEDGTEYILNGTKIWTTHAHFANHIFCLVRTATSSKRQHGISFLCFRFPGPGITVRPIISISGEHELNQVFFDDARVPASALVGEQDQGWTVAKYLLVHERSSPAAARHRARLRRLRGMLAQTFAGQPADSRERTDLARKLAEVECNIDALQALELRSLQAQMRGEPAGVAPSVMKVLSTETRQRLTELNNEIAGPISAAKVGVAEAGEGPLPLPEDAVFGMTTYFNDRAASIYAGTNEVQRNLIATHLIGRIG